MSRVPSYRPARLAALLQETLAETISTHMKDPRVGFVTVTGVTVSRDGSHARVRVSVLGSDEERGDAMEGLQSARGFLRSHLAKTLPLRVVPELRFYLDRGIEHARRIDEVLSDLNTDGES